MRQFWQKERAIGQDRLFNPKLKIKYQCSVWDQRRIEHHENLTVVSLSEFTIIKIINAQLHRRTMVGSLQACNWKERWQGARDLG